MARGVLALAVALAVVLVLSACGPVAGDTATLHTGSSSGPQSTPVSVMEGMAIAMAVSSAVRGVVGSDDPIAHLTTLLPPASKPQLRVFGQLNNLLSDEKLLEQLDGVVTSDEPCSGPTLTNTNVECLPAQCLSWALWREWTLGQMRASVVRLAKARDENPAYWLDGVVEELEYLLRSVDIHEFGFAHDDNANQAKLFNLLLAAGVDLDTHAIIAHTRKFLPKPLHVVTKRGWGEWQVCNDWGRALQVVKQQMSPGDYAGPAGRAVCLMETLRDAVSATDWHVGGLFAVGVSRLMLKQLKLPAETELQRTSQLLCLAMPWGILAHGN